MNECRHVLWTGGWDSTYRLLEVLLVEQRPVQPYYILSFWRQSLAKEIRIMATLKATLRQQFPEAAALLRPTQFRALEDIQPNPAITDAYHRLLSQSHIGNQYDWLARFAEQEQFEGLELGVHKGGQTFERLSQYVVKTAEGVLRLADDVPDPDLKLFYGRFAFPILNISKVEMQHRASEYGFDHLMEMTWFCHNPTPGGRPCGVCNPCRYAFEQGMRRRLPRRPTVLRIALRKACTVLLNRL